ncbi:MAG: glycosyltransferase [Acidimicrobiales bacterium]
MGDSPGRAVPTFPDAVWCQHAEWDEVRSQQFPVFRGPSPRQSSLRLPIMLILLARRAAQHPFHILRLLLRGQRPQAIANFLLWLDTASLFGVERVYTLDGQAHPLSGLVRTKPTRPPHRSRGSIGVVVLARNCEQRVARAIDSVSGLADKVLVLDDLSTDRTAEVSAAAGAEVLRSALSRDFARQRNVGNEYFRDYDWVLHVDSDEVVDPALAELLQGLAHGAESDAVILPHLNLFGSERPNPFPTQECRMMRPRLHWRFPVLERPAWRTAIVVPISGPYLVHEKTQVDIARSMQVYHSIDPSLVPDADLAWLRRVLDDPAAGD